MGRSSVSLLVIRVAIVASTLGGAAVLDAAVTNPEMQRMLERFKELEDFARLIEREYYTEVSREHLWGGALEGMLDQLDPHSRYIERKEALLQRGEAAQREGGFGFDWHPDRANERVVVARVVPGSPAAAAGLAPGDVVLAVQGRELGRLTLHQIRELMLGLENTCTLRVRHADGSTTQAELGRSPYRDDGIGEARIVDQRLGIGLVRIDRFIGSRASEAQPELRTVTRTGAAFRVAVDALAEKGLRALVLDLRGNGGGALSAAVEIADAFLNARPDEGTLIVAQVSRNPAHQARHLAHSNNTLPNWPVAILVDRHTASSAEVLAASLQDHHRAVLLGEPTAGKRSVQQRFALPSGAAMVLTVARYRTAGRRDPSDTHGLEPEIALERRPLEQLALARYRQALASGEAPEQPPTDTHLQRACEVLTAAVIHSGYMGFE